MSAFVPGAISADTVLDNLSLGLVALDKDFNILLWNGWMERHSGIDAGRALNASFVALFQQQLTPGFLRALSNTVSYGLPALLSSALHRSPLPLYHAPAGGGMPVRMVQSVVMTPIVAVDGSRACLIQVSDASHSIKREKMLMSRSEALKRQAVTDGLTGVYNRRFFDENFALVLQRARRNREALSLFMIDVDYFKQYNDLYGHLAGDRVLKRVAAALSAQLRSPADVFARYGGEEFVMLVAGADAAMAGGIAERLRQTVLALQEPHEGSQVARWVTVSVGACTAVPREEADGRGLMDAADAALYRAKLEGRDRVVVA
ncbi:MAG TPA: diguanylate cyclase [Stenotrophomonas sp.]|nr:diguanylate cyclase [Stenotrophomonas sp.]